MSLILPRIASSKFDAGPLPPRRLGCVKEKAKQQHKAGHPGGNRRRQPRADALGGNRAPGLGVAKPGNVRRDLRILLRRRLELPLIALAFGRIAEQPLQRRKITRPDCRLAG